MRLKANYFTVAIVIIVAAVIVFTRLPLSRFGDHSTSDIEPLAISNSGVDRHSDYDPEAPLTNEVVCRLTDEGVIDDILLVRMLDQECRFDTSPDQLAFLRKRGVSEVVIGAMIRESQTPLNLTSSEPPREYVPNAHFKVLPGH